MAEAAGKRGCPPMACPEPARRLGFAPFQGVIWGMSVNMRTAKALGLTIPPLLLAQADEVIE